MRSIAVVGSRSFPLTPEVGAEVVDILRGYEADTIFLTRGSSGFDDFIVKATELLDMRLLRFPAKGGADNFNRDVLMVKAADEVLAFFDPASLHDENTGTAHVVAKALDQKKITKAYTVAANRLVYAGSSD